MGLDPGITSGWAILDADDPDKVYAYGQLKYDSVMAQNRAYDYEAFCDFFFNQENPISHVVIEDFVGTGQRDWAMTKTMNMVGYFICMAHSIGVKPVMQTPKRRRAYIDLASHLLSEKRRGKNRHSVDACAQALSYIHKLRMKT